MPVPTVALDETSPPSSQAIRLGATRIKEFKTQVREIMAVDHKYLSTGQHDDMGKHLQCTFIEAANLGTGATGYGILGAQTVSGKPELVYVDEDDHDVQITTGGGINAAKLLVASQATGDLLVASSATAWARLGIGTALQLLRVNAGATALEWSAPATIPTAAAQSDQETASSTTLFVTPGRQHFHPAAAKAWVKFTGSTGAITASYNVTSVTRNATGDWTVNFTTAFSSAHYNVNATGTQTSGSSVWCIGVTTATPPTTTACRLYAAKIDSGGNGYGAYDPDNVYASFFGDI